MPPEAISDNGVMINTIRGVVNPNLGVGGQEWQGSGAEPNKLFKKLECLGRNVDATN